MAWMVRHSNHVSGVFDKNVNINIICSPSGYLPICHILHNQYCRSKVMIVQWMTDSSNVRISKKPYWTSMI